MILSSHQPNFLPYMGFFYKAYKSDAMALSFDVAFSKKGMHNWNTIYTKNGPMKLTLPVHAHHDTAIYDVLISDVEYNVGKIGKTLLQEYAKAPFYEDGLALVEEMERSAKACHGYLACFNANVILYISYRFGLKTEFLSTIPMGLTGHKDERILQMCKVAGATAYLSGEGARAYHVPENFGSNGIDLEYSHYTPIEYPQIHGPFVPNLSVADYIFNQGFVLPKGW